MTSALKQNERELNDSSSVKTYSSIDSANKSSSPIKRSNSRNGLKTSWKNPQYRVARKESILVTLKDALLDEPQLRRRRQPAKPKLVSMSKHKSTGSDDNDAGRRDMPGKVGCNQANFMYPLMFQQQQKSKYGKESSSFMQSFPFQKTPSGNFKLEPRQIVYTSKNLSVLAADPQKVVLNVTGSIGTEKAENDATLADFETKDGILPLSDTQGKRVVPIYSEFSDSTVHSDGGPVDKDGSSEISLARMGFVTDNCIEWSKIQLPKKNDLKTLLMQNIANKVNPDIKIKFGDNRNTFDCHRIVLQCYSDYFTTETGHLIELPADVVSKETFSVLYQWMSCQDANNYQMIRRDNVLDVFNAARYFGIKELEKQCVAFIENPEVFFEDKAFLLYLEARKHGNKNVMDLMVPRVQRFFLTLVSSKEFVELTFEEVCAFLSSDYASVHDETEMLMAAVRWLSHDWSGRYHFTVGVLSHVRFQFINSKNLLLLRRTKQPPEITRVVEMPEVTKMIDDAIAYHTIMGGNENATEEELDEELKKMNLSHPAPRNWAGTHKECHDYRDFLRELSCYRSKHRMEVKKSKIEMRTRDLDEEDFLSRAVLPENLEKRLSVLKTGDGSGHRHPQVVPRLPPREHRGLKRLMGEKESKKDVPRVAPLFKEQRESQLKNCLVRLSTKEELDRAARKIQRAYRGYTMRKAPSKDSGMTRPTSVDRSKTPRTTPNLSITPGCGTEFKLEQHTGVETVFIFGGFDPFANLQSRTVDTARAVYRYAVATNSWERCGELPEPRHYHAACLCRGKIYVAGGKHPGRVSAEGVSGKVWRYDPDYKRWCRVADLLRPRRAFGLVVCRNRLFAVGGRDEKGRVLSSVETYDPDEDRWTRARPLLEPRTGAGVCEFEGGVWVAGGLTGPDCRGSRTVERYDPASDEWGYRAPLRYLTAFPSLLPVDGRLYLVAGAIGHDRIAGSGRQVDVLDGTGWCLATKLATCRHAHAAVHLRGVPPPEPGHLLVLGGALSRRAAATADVECWRESDDVFFDGVAPLPQPACGFPALVLPRRTFSPRC